MKTAFFTIILICLSVSLYSTIINVPADQATIQSGISASANTDTVLVQPGTYVENINYNGKRITLASLFLTTQDKTYISSTIIDGNASGSVVTFENSENSTAILTGFTITNGSATTSGGGIYCNDAAPTLKNLVISENYSAVVGGGIFFTDADATLENVKILNNIANSNGGGIYCDTSDPSLYSVVIAENSINLGNGGGIHCYLSSPTLNKVTIYGNSAHNWGGGIYCRSGSQPVMLNSIMWGDTPEEIYVDDLSVTATYSDIEGGWTGTGNIDIDPLFVDAGNGDFHLQPASPCIDAGDPLSALDPDNTIVDMGVYYFHQEQRPFWHISTTGSDITGNGSEESPFASIQLGINFADSSNTVLVHPGTYIENINFNGKSISVGSLFLTTQDTSYISSTIIDGDSIASVVTFNSGEDSSVILSGFTITNGVGNFDGGTRIGGGILCNEASPTLEGLRILDNTSDYGGGIFFIDCSSSLENILVLDNTSYSYGGGICLVRSNSILENIDISGNSALGGGGLSLQDGSIATLINATIVDNTADSGGGMSCETSTVNLQNVTISGNSATNGGGIFSTSSELNSENVKISENSATDGGGIFLWGTGVNRTINNIIISDNIASGNGGGIFYYVYNVNYTTKTTLNNVTISENSSAYGGGIYCHSYSHIVLINSIMWNDSPQEIFLEDSFEPNLIKVSYSDVQGGESGIVVNNGMAQWQAGNINQYPLFLDAANEDYHLSWANFPIQDNTMSPCIDSGNPASSLDPDDTRTDMGAYYYPQFLTAVFQADVTSGIVPLTVNFSDNSFLATGVVEEWLWDFGDGENSSVQNPTHVYNDVGYHTVTLTVIGDNDSTDTEVKTDYIVASANEQPASPTNLSININQNNVELSWDAVNTSVFGNFLLPDYYLVFNSADPYSNFSFLGLSTETNYNHQYIAQFSDKNFYQVIAYTGSIRSLQNFIAEHSKFKKSELDTFIEKQRKKINQTKK